MQVGLRIGTGKDLHLLEEGPEEITSQPGVILALDERPFQFRVPKSDVHGTIITCFHPLGEKNPWTNAADVEIVDYH